MHAGLESECFGENAGSENRSRGQRLPTCIQERPEFQGQRGLFGNKLVHVTSHIIYAPYLCQSKHINQQ